MPTQVEQEQLEPCRVALTIQVPPEDIQKAMESVFSQYAKRATVPGFRPGKAPRHLVKRFIDEGRVRETALEQAMTNAYHAALKESGVEPYRDAEPKVELQEEQLDADKGFSFKATIPLQPQVNLGDLEGLSGRRVVTKIDDESIDRELERIRQQSTHFHHSHDAAEDGDRLQATIRTTVGGEIVEEATFEEPRYVQIGSNLPQLDEGLVGLKEGEEKTFEFTYPDDFPQEERRGQTASVEVKVLEVLKRHTPELDDDFAKNAGYDDLDALKGRVREALQAQADALADQELTDELIREVVRRATVHFPSEMIDAEISSRLNDLISQLERRNATLEDYLAAERKDLQTFQAELAEESVESLTNTLALLELARQNNISISEKEIEAEIKQRSEAEGIKTSEYRRVLNETGEITALRNRIFFRKIAAFLREKAEIREVEA